MTTINVSNSAGSNFRKPGVAEGFQTPDVYSSIPLLLSDSPGRVAVTRVIKGGTTDDFIFDLFQVVALDSSGKVIKHTYNATKTAATATQAYGIMAAAVDAKSSSSTDSEAQIYIAGHFNGDALIWDTTSYASGRATADSPTAAELLTEDERRRRAFDGAPNPNNIIVDFNPYWRLRNLKVQ